MKFKLGNDPVEFEVILSPGADFTQVLRRESGDWDEDISIELRFEAVTWPATIVDDTATWDVDKAEVDALLHSKKYVDVRLFYVNGALDVLWATGVGIRRG